MDLKNPSIKCVLLDIEGTTTSIDFVKNILFPYARENLARFLDEHWDNDPEVRAIVQTLRNEWESEAPQIAPAEAQSSLIRETLVQNLLWQMDRDRKSTGLKALQGKIWKLGYESGQLKGHVYEDVPKAFHTWTVEKSLKIAIYSSGSVEAQKLLFANSVSGDLRPYISNYFDTKIGPKTQGQSYRNIAKELVLQPAQIQFYTDIPKEAEAAAEAGLTAVLVLRPGNSELTREEQLKYSAVYNFTNL